MDSIGSAVEATIRHDEMSQSSHRTDAPSAAERRSPSPPASEHAHQTEREQEEADYSGDNFSKEAREKHDRVLLFATRRDMDRDGGADNMAR